MEERNERGTSGASQEGCEVNYEGMPSDLERPLAAISGWSCSFRGQQSQQVHEPVANLQCLLPGLERDQHY
jgi:hypothetical protein